MAAHPPGILLSLLPAPQQAILSFREDQSRETLYGDDDVPSSLSKDKAINEDDEEDTMEDFDDHDESDDFSDDKDE
eukprot:CAMPEP_0116835056 /NCGR_PEP_ID=MMETSP0418-20121206/7335_1 /TAXON_ID=1158023 /ORGANISM="Astrosyne radiata, Strain 13vi08-1A" /LENGTH=75 /DNA_ID=CAMNT_0004464685 /DNA_START=223 /DNA_END=450 /DNA_ORIENTATION=+